MKSLSLAYNHVYSMYLSSFHPFFFLFDIAPKHLYQFAFLLAVLIALIRANTGMLSNVDIFTYLLAHF